MASIIENPSKILPPGQLIFTQMFLPCDRQKYISSAKTAPMIVRGCFEDGWPIGRPNSM